VLLPERDSRSEREGATPGEILSLARLVRRVAIFVLGMTVVLIGVVMLVTPGPAFLVIPLGLAILATEFVWARRILERLKARLKRATASGGREPPEESQPV
jgi:uncharacterized protein (TIGR02611 family)